MTVDQYRQSVEDAKNRYLDQSRKAIESTNRAGGFGSELSDAVKQREDTFSTLNNDVNTRRADYYNTSDQLMPQMFEKYKDDPMYALQALGNERTVRNIGYRNADDIRNQKQGRIEDFIGSFNQSAQVEAQRQAQLRDLLQQEYGLADNEYQQALAQQEAELQRQAQSRALAQQMAMMQAPAQVEQSQVAEEEIDFDALPDLTEEQPTFMNLGAKDVQNQFVLNPFSEQNMQLGEQYRDYTKKQNQNWYDYINPVKTYGNLWNFLGKGER
jgi:hypothetical protein